MKAILPHLALHPQPYPYHAADPYISEFSATGTTLADEDGDTPDWIEIHNPGPDTVNLVRLGAHR